MSTSNDNTTNSLLCTGHPTRTGIVLNRMYTGSYLSSNLGHEVINMFPDDEGNHYMYLNATGDFSAEHAGKIGSMLLIKYAGQDEDGRPWVEVLGYATGLKDIYNPKQKKQSEEHMVPCNGGDKLKKLGDIKYGNVTIHNIFKDSAQQDVLISYYATKVQVPKEGVKIFLRFAPFENRKNRTNSSILTFAYSDNSDVEPSPSTYEAKIPTPQCVSYLWKKIKDEAELLYSSKLYVVEMETKFASTSLKRYYKKDEKGGDKEKIRKTNGDLEKIKSLITKGELWRDLPEGSLTMNDSSQSEENITKKKDVSIFDICRIENNENCFSNALAHFMDKYREEWCTKFFKGIGITLKENFEIFREVDATIPKNNNDETENSGGNNKKGGRIDILFKDKDNKNIIIIENKIKSDINGVKDEIGEGKQLKRYKDYAHWLKYQLELDKIKDKLQEQYDNSDCFDIHQDDGKVKITIKKQKKEPRHRTQEEARGEEIWRKYNDTEIIPWNVYLFVLSPNYNIPHIPNMCKEGETSTYKWESITYKQISNSFNEHLLPSEDTNLEDFFNVMQRHTCENLCDWLRIDMREKFIARINKLK